jgi:hypothetical protein
VYTASTNAFTTIPTTTLAGVGDYKYWGAAVLVDRVFFAGHHQNNVGVYTVSTSVFSTITMPAAVHGIYKYNGAVTVGDKVYFVPRRQANVGVVDSRLVSY